MKTLDQLKAEQAAAIAKLERETAVAQQMPVVPNYVDASRSMGWPFVSYKVEGIRGAIDMLKNFVVVPFVEYKDGFTRLQPMQFVPEEKRDKHSAQWALSIDVSTHFFSHCDAGTTLNIEFFARVEQLGIVKVRLDVTGPGYIGSFNALGATCQIKANKVVRGSVRPNAALYGAAQRCIAWGTGSDEWANHAYLVNTDYEGQDASVNDDTLVHTVAVLQNLSDEFDAKEAK